MVESFVDRQDVDRDQDAQSSEHPPARVNG